MGHLLQWWIMAGNNRNTLETALVVTARTEGEGKIKGLADELEKLSSEAGDAAPKFIELANDLKALAAQDELIQDFGRLKRETVDTGAALDAAATRVDSLSQALAESASRTAAATTAQQAAGAALDAARAKHDTLKLAVAGAANELRNLKVRAKESGDASGVYAQQIEAAKGKLDGLKTESQSASAAVKALAADQKGSVSVLREAEQAERKLSTEYNQSVGAAKRLSAELGAKNRALASTRENLQGAGIDAAKLGAAQQKLAADLASAKSAIVAQVQSLQHAREAEQARAQEVREQAAEEQRLAAIVTATKAKMAAAAQEQLAAEKRAYAEAMATAKRYDEQTRAIASGLQNAFSTIGIRSAATIQAEILRIDQALIRLANDANVSGEELDRAFAHGAKRSAELKRELAGAADPFVSSMNRAGVGVDGLMTKLRPLAGALAASFSVQQGVQALTDANLQAERLARSLATIATPAHSAREQLEWLRDMAERNGVAFDRLGQSFISFAASTRGTALEGEKTREIYDAIVTSMGRMGRTSDEVAHALQAVSQMASKGTVSMEELRGQLSEAMPGALQSLARGLGLTTEQLIKMVSEGRLLAEDALPALQRELQKTIDATSEDKVAGMEAGWNRLTNAIGRALDAGQEKRNTTGAFLEWMAQGVDGLTERSTSLEVSWAGLVRAIETGDWSAYTNAVETHQAAVAASKDTATLAAEQHRILGAAALQAGTQAQQSAPAWTALDSAYTQILVHVREQIALAEKNAIARQAEGTAAVALAQAFGTEAEQRSAAVTAAAGNAEALKAVALQRQTEVATLQAQIAALRENMVANKDESNAHKESIAALQTQLAVRQADAERATAQAGASRLAAEAARAEAAAQADNSGRVVELRAAYEAARATLETVRAARAANKVEAEALTNAELAAARAAHAYRDALNDQAAAIKANLGLKQAQIALDQSGIQLSMAVAQRTYEVAKARGDERGATEALIKMKRLEADLTDLQAKALKAQATAELEAVKNKLEQAKASGTLTKQMQAELEAERLLAEAKLVQGKISEETAAKLRALAREGAQAGSEIEGSMHRAAAATDGVGEAASRASQKFDSLRIAARKAASAVQQTMVQGTESVSANGGMRGEYTSPLTDLYAEAEAVGGKALRARAEAIYTRMAKQMEGLTATPERIGKIMSEIDVLIANARAQQNQQDVPAQQASTRSSSPRRGSMSGQTQYTAPGAGAQAPGPHGVVPDRVYRVDLTVAGRNHSLFGAPGDVDGFLAALESAQRSAS